MKVRQGFVSNSSSSSFCIYGTYLDIEKFLELCGKWWDLHPPTDLSKFTGGWNKSLNNLTWDEIREKLLKWDPEAGWNEYLDRDLYYINGLIPFDCVFDIIEYQVFLGKELDGLGRTGIENALSFVDANLPIFGVRGRFWITSGEVGDG